MTAITEKDLQEWTALCVDPWNGSHLRGDLSRVICTAMPRLIEEVTELREENKQLREEVERLVRGQTLDGFSMSYGKLLLKCDQLRARAERAEFAAMIAQDGRGKKRPWQPYSNKPPMRRRRVESMKSAEELLDGFVENRQWRNGALRAIKAAQEEARREALEEALRLAESHPGNCNHKKNPFCCDDYARQLRALIDKEPKK